MASVGPIAPSTKETTNYARLCRLLVDIGTQALRERFDSIHPPASLHVVLAVNKRTLQSLRARKVINPIQWGKLFPPIPTSVSSHAFDATLLMLLLRNLCGLSPPPTGWNALPAVTDLSMEADIVRVKYYRNTVYGHADNASVDDIKFNDYWRDIRDTLVRLGGVGYKAAIDHLRNECMDPEIEDHYMELLQQWKKDEDNIKEELGEIKKMLHVLTTSKEVTTEDQQRALSSVGNAQSADGSVTNGSVQGHEIAIHPTQGNPGSTTVNSLMNANINPLASGSTSAVFAGANIGNINVGSFHVYHGSVTVAQSDQNRQVTETDRDD